MPRISEYARQLDTLRDGVAAYAGAVGAVGAAGESIYIGHAELVRSYSLLVPQDSVAIVSTEIRGWTFRFEITFENIEGEDSKVLFVRKQDDVGALTLLNWNIPFGICLAEPVEIACLEDGSEILLLASNCGIGKSNRLELHLLLQR